MTDIVTMCKEYAASFLATSLSVPKKYSTLVSKVINNGDAVLIVLRNKNEYTFPHKANKEEALKIFNEFIDRYHKIKNGGQTERDKYSLGKYFNELKVK